MCGCRLYLALAFGQLTVPERGMVTVTWPILLFYIPLNIFGTAKAADFKFWYTVSDDELSPAWAWSGPCDAFYNFIPLKLYLERRQILCACSLYQALAFERPTIPEKGVARVTRSISEFYTPLNFCGLAEDRIIKFCARAGPRSISLVMTTCPPSRRGQDHVTS